MHEAMTQEIYYSRGYDRGWADAQEGLAKKFDKVLSENPNQWSNIKDKLPKIGDLLLYYFDPIGIHLGFYRGYDWCNIINENDESKVCRKQGHVFEHYMNMGCLCGEVTHWASVAKLTQFSMGKF